MTAGTTPHVDRVLADPLRVPAGLDGVLRRMERGAREQRDRLAPLAARADAAEPVRAAAAELHRFLEDGERSPLLRALRRPLRQIAPDTPGGRSLARCWEGVRARADAAAELQAALDGIRAAVARVRARFGDEVPRATRALLAAEGLDEAELARVRRADDVPPLHRRLRRAEHALEQLWARVDPGAAAALERGAAWDKEASPGEVLALVEVRLRERARLLHERDGARTLRGLAARQVRALGQAGGWARPAATHAHAVAQRLGALLAGGGAGARGGEDLALWGGMLGAAADTVHGGGGWAAQLPNAAPPEARETGTTRFVVPLDGTYALVTPHLPSAVRVVDRRMAMDRVVDCAVFLEHGDVQTLPLARMDVQPLFDGLDDAPGWYATHRRAQLQAIARTGDAWIARVHRRGTLRRTGGDAWDGERADGGRLRVLGTLSAPAPDTPWEVGPGPEAQRTFCGVATVPVAAPLAECAVGWLRAGQGSPWADEAVRAEEACFRAVARAVPGTVPAWAGRGRWRARGMEGPLYVPPLGLRPAELPPLDAWLRSAGAQPLLAAAARLWLRVTGAGWGLGAYHVDAFAFRPGWGEGTAHAVATDAPFATALGRPYRPPPPEESLHPLYSGLGCRVLAPALARGDAATAETEAQAFVILALDALAVRPPASGGIVGASVLAAMVPDHADCFAHPDLALPLARALLPGASAGGVMEWIRALAGPAAAD